MKIERKKLVLYLLFLFLASSISEVIYLYNREYSKFAVPFLTLSNTFTKTNKLEKSLYFLDKAADIFINENRRIYSEEFKNIKKEKTKYYESNETKDKILSYLKSALPDAYEKMSKDSLAKIYYDIGLIFFSANEINYAKSSFKNASLISPTLSFLHIELSNLYFTEGNLEEGEKILKFCIEFDPPRDHCEKHLTENVPQMSFEKIGSFKDVIHKYLEN